MANSDWRKTGKDKAEATLALIPSEWRIAEVPSIADQKDVTGPFIHQYLNSQEIVITETDAVGIVEKTTTGAWKAVDVVRAFCHRAAVAHQLVSCLHEIFFEDAIAQAERLDEYYAEHKKPVGPLHGLPVSLKDQFHVRNVETTMGYVGWIGTFQGKKGTGKERIFESEMVRELRSLGAVLYCKTSVPHTLMCGETVNNIVGYTYNPKNRLLSSGGSSGGEGALIAARGSCVGFGTDIGGSVRIPAAFNGLYGLRPSAGRLPYEGMANSMDGQGTILSVVGPLATSPGALKLITKALLGTKPWLHDPLVHEIPWREDAERLDDKLCIGVMRGDDACTPTPPISRAIGIVVKALERAGHATIPWKPTPNHNTLLSMASKAWALDGGTDCAKDFALSGEAPDPRVMMDTGAQANASDIMALNIAKREAQKAYMEFWNSTESLTGTGRPVDAVIAPVAPWPAARPEKYTYYTFSGFVNVLDYTSVTVPVTIADKAIDKRIEDFQPLSSIDRISQDAYDPDIYDGAHVGIQIVGRRLQEEKMIALATYVSELLQNRG